MKDCYYNKKTIKLASDIFKTFGVTTEQLDRDINGTKNLQNNYLKSKDEKYINTVLQTVSTYCTLTVGDKVEDIQRPVKR